MDTLSLFFALGRPLSPLYSLLMTARAALFKKDILKRYTLPVPVISIGNLTMGGSGKTPVVMSLARLLKDRGYHPAIISRGYGGAKKEKYNVVSTGEKILLSAEEAGDEPFMLAKALEGVPVITGTSRIHPCRYAINTFKADIILLDDGFQHLAIKRNFDLVLFNATTLAGNSRVFPGGILREPVKALDRCHAFMLTGITDSNSNRVEQFSSLLKKRFPTKPLFSAKFSQYEITSPGKHKNIVNTADMGRVYGFCAIAHPVRFQDSIKTAGINLLKFTTFRDHTKYSQRSLDKLCSEAKSCGAESLLTTEKDFVKIRHYKPPLPLYVLKIKLKFDSRFEAYLLDIIRDRLVDAI